jgi:hypothetical protein
LEEAIGIAVFCIVKKNLNPAGILLTVTLAVPLVLAVLAVVSRFIGAIEVAVALLLLSTVSVYVSLAAGLLVPIWIAVAWLFGRSVERRTIVALLLLSVLNIAVAITWIRLVVPQIRFRY